MPIYAYKCESCGHQQDVLQKISDPLLTVCPACGASAYVKQVTAAGFQLKGSGWYVTDFRDNGGKKPGAAADKGDEKGAGQGEGQGDGKGGDKPAEAGADKAAAPVPAESSSGASAAPAAAPAAPAAAPPSASSS